MNQPIKPITDLKYLEMLAAKSCDLLDKQISSYRQKHSNSGIIISIQAFFIPIFLTSLVDPIIWIKLASIVPISCMMTSTILFLIVLKGDDFSQGFHVKKFSDLINTDYESILLYEIGANHDSFSDNVKPYNKSTKLYKRALTWTTIALVSSVLLYGTNEVINYNSLINKNAKTTMAKEVDKNEKKEEIKVLPRVPEDDRTKLNEDNKIIERKN